MPPTYAATFSFAGFQAQVTGIRVEEPVAEVVDMTPITFDQKFNWLVPTGHTTGGTVTVDFLYKRASDFTPPRPGFIEEPDLLVGVTSQLTFNSTRFGVSKRAVLESASVDVRTGQLVSGQMTFRITDF
jgi:hypothetical protein